MVAFGVRTVPVKPPGTAGLFWNWPTPELYLLTSKVTLLTLLMVSDFCCSNYFLWRADSCMAAADNSRFLFVE